MALKEYRSLKQECDRLNRAIQEIDTEIRFIQRRLSRAGNSRRQPNTPLERVGLSTQINQLRAQRARLSVQLRRVKLELQAYDPN